jgi:hypothetical protein
VIPTTAAPTPHDITYTVSGVITGDACQQGLVCTPVYAGIDYINANGTSTQNTHDALPASIHVTLTTGAFYSILGQLTAPGYNDLTYSISCAVYEDGHQILTNTSNGPAAEVDCHGEVP